MRIDITPFRACYMIRFYCHMSSDPPFSNDTTKIMQNDEFKKNIYSAFIASAHTVSSVSTTVIAAAAVKIHQPSDMWKVKFCKY